MLTADPRICSGTFTNSSHCSYACTDMRNCMKYFWLRSPTQLLIQGQWWSIRRMQCLRMRQW